MPSISFDPVAHAYDRTRGYPPAVVEQIAVGLAQAAQAGGQTAFLEVGVGTGRIALPLASLGHTYTGVDISEKMLARLAHKALARGWQENVQPWASRADEAPAHAHPVRRFTSSHPAASLRLVTSDITTLPFPAAAFDVVVAVHVFHLVDGWQQAVRESLRVLRPGGRFLHGRDTLDNDALSCVTETWIRLVQELGGDARRVGPESPEAVSAWLREQGLPVEELVLARWETSETPRSALERIRSRLWSRTWSVPDALFHESVRRLSAWAQEYFGSTGLDTPFTGTSRFVVHRTGVPEL